MTDHAANQNNPNHSFHKVKKLIHKIKRRHRRCYPCLWDHRRS